MSDKNKKIKNVAHLERFKGAVKVAEVQEGDPLAVHRDLVQRCNFLLIDMVHDSLFIIHMIFCENKRL